MTRVAPYVEAKDRGWKRIMADMAAFKAGAFAQVGVFDPEIAKYGYINEYGWEDHIPARPWMATTAQMWGAEMRAYKAELIRKVLDGKLRPRRALYFIGVRYQARMRLTLRMAPTWAVPNAPATVAKKGFQYPLKHTGALHDAVSYRIMGMPGR